MEKEDLSSKKSVPGSEVDDFDSSWSILGKRFGKMLERRYGKTFIQNEGMFMLISGFYKTSVFYKIFNTCFIGYYTTLYGITAYLGIFDIDDPKIVPEAVHLTVVCTVLTSFCVSHLFMRDGLTEIYRYIENGFYKYGNTINDETNVQIEKLTLQTKRRKLFIRKFFSTCIVISGGINPVLVPMLFGRYNVEVKDDNIQRNLPLVKYNPMGNKGMLLYVVTFLMDVYAGIISPAIIISVDVAFFCFSEEGCNQLSILTVTLKQLFRRAEYLYRNKYNQEVESYGDYKFIECLKTCMNDSIQHHVSLIKYFNTVTKTYRFIIFIVIITGTFLLCMSGVILIVSFNREIDSDLQHSFMLFMISELTHQYLFAYNGERMLQLSSGLREAMYSMEWEDSIKGLKSHMLITQAYMNSHKITLDAAGFGSYDHNTFGNVLRGAYGYFNLLFAKVNAVV